MTHFQEKMCIRTQRVLRQYTFYVRLFEKIKERELL